MAVCAIIWCWRCGALEGSEVFWCGGCGFQRRVLDFAILIYVFKLQLGCSQDPKGQAKEETQEQASAGSAGRVG